MNKTIDVLHERTFEPIGTNHDLQMTITECLSGLIQKEGRCSLSELGYLHMSTLLFDRAAQCMELKIYFDARFAARVTKNNMGKKVTVPVSELCVFQNYFYVGLLSDVASFEKIMGPRSDVVKSPNGRASLQLKDGGKLTKYDALVLNCNVPISMATLVNADISNGHHFEIQMLDNPTSKESDDIVVSVSKNMIPVGIRVRYEEIGYHPSMAVPYLRSLLATSYERDSHRIEIVQDIQERAEKNKKKAKVVSDQSFGGRS